MFIDLFYKLRQAGIPVTITEYLQLLDALAKGVASANIDQFYYLARAGLVKDERFFDRFDEVFGDHFKGLEAALAEWHIDIPGQWLEKRAELDLSEEEKKQIDALGAWAAIMAKLKARAKAQQGRHEGGDEMIGTAGRSPFGAHGYNPQGVSIGQGHGRQRRAVKVWERRAFKNLDDSRQLGTRNIQLALRQLRRFARQGAADELDLDDTIRATAHNAGHLDIKMRAERHNAIKVLLFLDVGGSMDPYMRLCEELFSAARSAFKNLEYFYFHNCVYENLWQDNRRRDHAATPTMEVMRKYGPDYKLIFVGDASMSPYEIMLAGGSVEHANDKPGAIWLGRLLRHYPYAVWLNPLEQQYWQYAASIRLIKEVLQGRMYALSLAGLNEAIAALKLKAAR